MRFVKIFSFWSHTLLTAANKCVPVTWRFVAHFDEARCHISPLPLNLCEFQAYRRGQGRTFRTAFLKVSCREMYGLGDVCVLRREGHNCSLVVPAFRNSCAAVVCDVTVCWVGREPSSDAVSGTSYITWNHMLIPDVSNERAAVIFRVSGSIRNMGLEPLKVKATRSFETSVTACPVAWRHSQGNRNPRLHRCKSLQNVQVELCLPSGCLPSSVYIQQTMEQSGADCRRSASCETRRYVVFAKWPPQDRVLSRFSPPHTLFP